MKKADRTGKNERGYALVGIMTVMMFALILTTAAAPRLKFESQREKEEEMLWRGQQIATALKKYQGMRGGFPTDLSDLVKGIDIGTKKIRFLRPSALCDPMTPCSAGESNWRTVHPGDPLVKELLEAYLQTREKGQMVLPPPPPTLVQFAAMGGTQLPGGLAGGLGLGGSNPPPPPPPGAPPGGNNDTPSGGDGKSDDKLKGPIIGVVSKKTDRMFRNYYGIEQYDHTLFFPDVNVMVSGFINPLILAGAISSPSGPDPNCPGGGVFIDGKCWGGLRPGQYCRGPNGETVPCT
jgi:type II secretory pathway pseudopilin PulG